MSKKEDAKSILKPILLAVFFAAIILIFFNSLSNRASVERTEKVETEVEQLSNYDMLGEYPKTPRDVVKLHNRYFELFYSEKLTDDELVVLNQQVRCLYSAELLSLNEENNNLVQLKKNIESMKDEDYEYKSYELPEPSQILYYTQNDVEMATLEVTITLKMEDSMGYMYIQYVLVNENDQWKIHAWGPTQLN
ncbi:MAG: hypothetical protein IJX12_01110 [Lachnospiraceae bacterium]|nr:hypothetical protein [Lachnospiraceae bacterium]